MKIFDISDYKIASYSFLKNLNDRSGCPALALNYKAGQMDRKQSYAMHEGSVLDTLILDPDNFHERYFVTDKVINTEGQDYQFCEKYVELGDVKQAKEESGHRYKIETLEAKLANGWGEYIAFIETQKDKTPCSTELYDKASYARDVVMENSPLPDYMENADVQKMLKWKNRDSGIKCKGEPDICKENDFVLDLKKTQNAAPEIFGSRFGDMRRFGYLEQVAAYAEALGHDGMDNFVDAYIFAVQLDPIPLWSMHKISYMDLETATENFNTWCQKFKFISENDLWHLGYEFNIMYSWDDNENAFYLSNPSMITETSVYW